MTSSWQRPPMSPCHGLVWTRLRASPMGWVRSPPPPASPPCPQWVSADNCVCCQSFYIFIHKLERAAPKVSSSSKVLSPSQQGLYIISQDKRLRYHLNTDPVMLYAGTATQRCALAPASQTSHAISSTSVTWTSPHCRDSSKCRRVFI